MKLLSSSSKHFVFSACPLKNLLFFITTVLFLAQLLCEQIPHNERQECICQHCFSWNSAPTGSRTVQNGTSSHLSCGSYEKLCVPTQGAGMMQVAASGSKQQLLKPRLSVGNEVPVASKARARRRTKGEGCSCPAARTYRPRVPLWDPRHGLLSLGLSLPSVKREE